MGKIKVLIVDDDMKFAKNLGSFLRIMGYETNEIGTGESALKLIEDDKPDILLCDLKLPDIDGKEIVRKAKEISPKTILFIISAYVDSSIEERFEKLGLYAFIYKPVLFDDVIALFKKAISDRNLTPS